MIPKCETEEREQTFDITIEQVEKVLNENYKERGATDKAIKKLKNILEGLKGK